MNTCYIFGSLNVAEFKHTIDSSDYVIAADKGLLNTQKLQVTPNIIVGDFDSLSYIPEGNNVIQHPVMKDDTDLLLAVKIALNKGFKDFRIFGCLGGERLDHTIASIQTACYIKNAGANALLYDGDTTLSINKDEEIIYPESTKGIISLFAFGEKAVVSEEGLLYELNNKEITNAFPLGVSNEFIGKKAKITIHSGTALIITKNTCEV